jgi:stage II sporulation protein AA (anti-sigma F factor antagonist)
VLLTLVDSHPTVTVDITGLTFLDSSGINVLAVAHKTALEREARFEIRGAAGIAARALEVVGVEQVLNIAPTDG